MVATAKEMSKTTMSKLGYCTVAVCSILVVLFAFGGFAQEYSEGHEENLSLGRGFGVGIELNTPFWNVPTGIFLEFCFSDAFALQLSCGDYARATTHGYFGGMARYRIIDTTHLDLLVYLHGIAHFREGFMGSSNWVVCSTVITGLIGEYSLTKHLAVNCSVGSISYHDPGYSSGYSAENIPTFGIGITYYFL